MPRTPTKTRVRKSFRTQMGLTAVMDTTQLADESGLAVLVSAFAGVDLLSATGAGVGVSFFAASLYFSLR